MIRFRLKSPMYVRTYCGLGGFEGVHNLYQIAPRRPETARGRPQTPLGRLQRRPGGVTVTPQWQSWDYTAYTSEFKASSDLPPSPSAHLAPRYFGQPPPARFPPGPARQPQGGEPMFSRASPFGDRLFSYPGFSETRHSPVDPLRETVCSSTPFAKHRVLQHVFGRTSRFPALLVQRTAVFQAPSLRLD